MTTQDDKKKITAPKPTKTKIVVQGIIPHEQIESLFYLSDLGDFFMMDTQENVLEVYSTAQGLRINTPMKLPALEVNAKVFTVESTFEGDVNRINVYLENRAHESFCLIAKTIEKHEDLENKIACDEHLNLILFFLGEENDD